MKKYSFIIGLLGAILGIASNLFIILLPDISRNLRMFTIAAIIFSVIALLGVLFSSKIKSLELMMLFLGVVSNIPVSITSGINNIILGCILSGAAVAMLLISGIIQVVE